MRRYLRTFSLGYFCLSLVTVLGIGILWYPPPAPASQPALVQTPDTEINSLNSLTAQQTDRSSSSLIQQGRDLYKAGNYKTAIQVWQQAVDQLVAQGNWLSQASVHSHLALAYQNIGQSPQTDEAISTSLQLLDSNPSPDQPDYWSSRGQVQSTQGTIYLLRSQPTDALSSFQQAERDYRQASNNNGILRSQVNQAQALQALGFYRRALNTLTDLNPPLADRSPSLSQITGLRNLGDLLRITGDLEQSQTVLEQSLTLAQQLGDPIETAKIRFSLGNTIQAQGNTDQALNYFEQVSVQPVSSSLRLKANITRLSLLFETGKTDVATSLLADIRTQLTNQPVGRTSVYTRLVLARNLLDHAEPLPTNETAQLLQQALDQAQDLRDRRAESYAMGYLGELYNRTANLSEAQVQLASALAIAQNLNAADIAYRWQWQLGQLSRQQGNLTDATTAYSDAVKSLQSLRNELVAINPDIQYDFREKVEPVYRELVDLLLTPSSTESNISQNKLLQARDVIESLQLAELENFFREPCLAVRQQIDQVVDDGQSATAVLYPIILPDRLEVILKLPNQPLQHYATPLAQTDLEVIINDLRQQVVRSFGLRSTQSLAKQIYDSLLKPAESALEEAQVDTLIFILDGALRNIPMATLYDGQQYLVQKYSLALAPGLKLVDPKPLVEQDLAAITAGLSESRHGFIPLPFVNVEVEQIQSTLDSRVLLNETFTESALTDAINQTPFPVVHLATHGQFSSNPEETFILAWDNPIQINALNRLLRNSEQSRQDAIELLVLSACETATGDKQAALGLAGVAVRAGARSTLASLWNIDDETSAVLMQQFYQVLIDNPTTKASALRQAQLALLKNPRYQHPRYWAPYVLVGNWL
ncbi:CHAT domain-containing protein [Leptolyngbyaceae cyanobacterium CCMR0082]|uniref:CHAT domain-containing protein n=1 Tax=Adonisia turfae CCMR0082 TaxID=2304604 RepID=A0A6M0SFH8_9CYAN|nr:CHAT domain-containing protein [Adonisia turfae CCMR0082]